MRGNKGGLLLAEGPTGRNNGLLPRTERGSSFSEGGVCVCLSRGYLGCVCVCFCLLCVCLSVSCVCICA